MKPVKEGELLEAAPVCSFPSEQRTIIDKTTLFEYYFVRKSEYTKQTQVDGHIVFGLSSFCNHSNSPNAEVRWVDGENGLLWVHLIALKDIHADEEVTISYANLDEYPLANKFLDTIPVER